MSTRCMIGLEMPDKTIKAIYCHYDGYPEGVGKTLQEHYADPDKVAKLMEMGDTWCDYFYLFTTTDHTGVYRWHYASVPFFKPLDMEDEEE